MYRGEKERERKKNKEINPKVIQKYHEFNEQIIRQRFLLLFSTLLLVWKQNTQTPFQTRMNGGTSSDLVDCKGKAFNHCLDDLDCTKGMVDYAYFPLILFYFIFFIFNFSFFSPCICRTANIFHH
jgi:hypothetical protein